MRLSALVLAAAFGLGSIAAAQARTADETKAIVLKFNTAFGHGLNAQQLGAMMSDDFIEHHPTAGTPERTKSEFIARFAADGADVKKMPGGPPVPLVTTATPEYVLLMSPRPMTAPKTGKPYDAFSFDLFRVDDAGKVAEHWDSWTLNDSFGPPPKK